MRLLIGLLFTTTLHALVTITAGALQCGALTRSVNTVQTYCYASNVVVFNAIHTVTGPGIITMYQYTGTNGVMSMITWRFKLQDTVVSYDVTTDSKIVKTGTL